MNSSPRSNIANDIASVLEEVHEHLDNPTTLESLAQRSGYSPFHFHRNFSAAVGETPKQHVSRMRIERAAYLIAITDRRFTDIAFDVGFEAPETFTRAFRRHFQMSPTEYRALAKSAQNERMTRNEFFTGDGCELSTVRVLMLPAATLLSVRHFGAYSEVRMPPFGDGDELWTALRDHTGQVGVEHDGTAWSICHDNPVVTPGPQQRLDACIGVQHAIANVGRFKCIDFAGGLYAAVEHTGPHETISQAYAHVADAVRRSGLITFGTGPLVQIFRHIDAPQAKHRTEVYFPVVRL